MKGHSARVAVAGAVRLTPSPEGARQLRRSLEPRLDSKEWQTIPIPAWGVVALASQAVYSALLPPDSGFAACRRSARSGNLAERIAEAYRTRGEALSAAMEESFSAVVYDSSGGRLVLACDTFASAGMWYFIERETLYFADDCEALFDLFDAPRLVCPQSLDSYFVIGQILPPETGYRGIDRVPINAALVVGDGRAALRRALWQPTVSGRGNPNDAVDAVHEALEGACACIDPCRPPIALLFSGGLDSTLLAVMLRKYYPDLKACLLSNSGSDSQPRRGAEALGLPLQSVHTACSDRLHPSHFVMKTGFPAFSFAESYISAFLANISGESDQFVNGCGADTVFLSTETMGAVAAGINETLPGRRSSYRNALLLPRFLGAHKRAVRRLLYTPEFRRILDRSAPIAHLTRAFVEFGEAGASASMIMQYLTMNHSRNVALYSGTLRLPKTMHWPYLSKRFITAVLSATAATGQPCDRGKTILRSILARYLAAPGDEYVKSGFGELLLLEGWFTPSRLRDAQAEVLESGICDAGILATDAVNQIFDACAAPSRPPALLNLAWSVFALSVWYQAAFTGPLRD